MTAGEFARLLDGKRSGDGWQARCPAHKDRQASLSIREADDGRTLLKCHAGCSFEAVIAAARVDAAGLVGDCKTAFTKPLQIGLSDSAITSKSVPEAGGKGFGRPKAQNGCQRLVATYDYVDEDGDLLYQRLRYDPKEFKQRRLDGDGWAWNLNGVRRVLYRLPEVLAAKQRAVWIAEGEKDADALVELGLPATTAGSAGVWQDDFTNSLKGCAWALVVPDCDESGRKSAGTIATSLHRAGVKTKVVELDGNRNDGYDVADFLLEHGDGAKERLMQLAKAALQWPKTKPLRAPIRSAVDWASGVSEHDDSKDYLGAFFHGGERVHIIGPTGHGKTTFILEAISYALHGRTLLGWKGKGDPLRACYVNLEMPNEALKRELRDAGLLDPALGDRFGLWDVPEGLEIDQNSQHREMLADLFAHYQIVALDPWFKLIADELADGMRNVRPISAFLDGMRKQHPETVMVIGFHANEMRRAQKLGLIDASGYKAFHRNTDIALLFQRVAGNRSRLTWAKTRDWERLPKIGEHWLVDWEPGESFTRVERRRATDELLAIMGRDWQSVYDLVELSGKSRSTVIGLLSALHADGRVEHNGGSESGGRGHMRLWRLANADQMQLVDAA